MRACEASDSADLAHPNSAVANGIPFGTTGPGPVRAIGSNGVIVASPGAPRASNRSFTPVSSFSGVAVYWTLVHARPFRIRTADRAKSDIKPGPKLPNSVEKFPNQYRFAPVIGPRANSTSCTRTVTIFDDQYHDRLEYHENPTGERGSR